MARSAGTGAMARSAGAWAMTRSVDPGAASARNLAAMGGWAAPGEADVTESNQTESDKAAAVDTPLPPGTDGSLRQASGSPGHRSSSHSSLQAPARPRPS